MAASSATVSIITPCYNGARYLRETLESALSQTCPPLEIIVIDDGSTDDSAAVAEAVGRTVRVIRQTNRGQSAARNRGIAEVKGSHVLFLDADDLLEPESLERLAGALEGKPEAVALMGCGWFTTDPASIGNTQHFADRDFFPAIIGANLGPIHCWLTPTHVLRRVRGFCETMGCFEDWDLWWRVGLEGVELVPVDFLGARYRLHPQSRLATIRGDDRARGHVMLMTRLAVRLLERPDLLDRYAKPLFWNVWAALMHARDRGVSWAELREAADALSNVATFGSRPLRGTLMAQAVRMFGVRAASALQVRERRPAWAPDADPLVRS